MTARRKQEPKAPLAAARRQAYGSEIPCSTTYTEVESSLVRGRAMQSIKAVRVLRPAILNPAPSRFYR